MFSNHEKLNSGWLVAPPKSNGKPLSSHHLAPLQKHVVIPCATTVLSIFLAQSPADCIGSFILSFSPAAQ
jgi:hypothetical protein